MSITVPRGAEEVHVDRVIDDAFAWLRRADELFSPYLETSEVSRLRAGTVTVERCSPEMGIVLDLCERLRKVTDGYFDSYAAGPDLFDPSGLVKGWAAELASDRLVAGGITAHCLNAGGDVRLRGEPEPDRPWRTGIVDPREEGMLIAVVAGRDLAVATSGIYERGLHVLDPFRRTPARELLSVTVVGPSLTWADGYATAAVARGATALRWLSTLEHYEGLVVDVDGRVSWTPGFPRYAKSLPDGPHAPAQFPSVQ